MVPPPVGDPLTKKRSEILWRLVDDRDHPPQTLIDCGCGEGQLVAEARTRGIDALGLDISEEALARARRFNPEQSFTRHGLEDTPWPVEADTFDIVIAFEVVEHLLEPWMFFLGAHQVLKPGGHLAITTPYHGVIKNIAISLAAFDRHFDPRGDHIRFFSDRMLGRMLREAGFVVADVIHFGRLPGLWAGTFFWATKVGT